MPRIRMSLLVEDSVLVVNVADDVEERRVDSLDKLRRLLADRGESLTDIQHHGLGLTAVLLALEEYADQYSVRQLGKVMDAIYFPSSRPSAGQAFSRAVGEALFDLQRADDVNAARHQLIANASFELGGGDPRGPTSG